MIFLAKCNDCKALFKVKNKIHICPFCGGVEMENISLKFKEEDDKNERK